MNTFSDQKCADSGKDGTKRPDLLEESDSIWIFPTWKWVYGAVLTYGTLVILALWILTRILGSP